MKERNKKWSDFVDRTKKGYITIAMRHFNYHDAEDIVHTAYYKMLKKGYDLSDIEMDKLGFRIVHNECVNKIKYKLSMSRDRLNDAPYEEWMRDVGAQQVSSAQMDAETIMSGIRKHVSDHHFRIFKSFVLDNMMYKDIAKEESVPLGTVRSAIHQVRKKIKEHYGEFA